MVNPGFDHYGSTLRDFYPETWAGAFCDNGEYHDYFHDRPGWLRKIIGRGHPVCAKCSYRRRY